MYNDFQRGVISLIKLFFDDDLNKLEELVNKEINALKKSNHVIEDIQFEQGATRWSDGERYICWSIMIVYK